VDAGHAGLKQALAAIVFEQGRVDEAIATAREAIALQPANASAHSDLLRMLNYADMQDPAAVAREHRDWAQRHERPLADAAPPHANVRDPARRLRIGYVSPYFRKHAVTFFLEPVIEHHDRNRFEIILYADVAQPDEYSARLRAHGAAWRSTVGASDAGVAAMIRADAVDILVDLSGHTPGNRLLAFARKSAPVQVTWNGYPNTTGMTGMDYRITDAACDPPGATAHLHSEKLVRLPGVYMAWRPPEDAPDVGPPPALAAGHVTFGSFNSCYKITPRLIAVWSRILERVPHSRLMLLTIGAGAAERRIRSLFARHGIGAPRMDIRPRVTHENFLAIHNEVDIALDAFPYHGTTTTCFSLWMGLPVVTLAGATHVSRVGASLLNHAGLRELVASTDDEYVDFAAKLAHDLPRLAALRAKLRGMLLDSPLTDGAGYARNLERAYREMWAAYCAACGKV
jgi:predicted O-linked N-acetylglucosamine transferase (SPINDLY family)